jgi:hypothetical protein
LNFLRIQNIQKTIDFVAHYRYNDCYGDVSKGTPFGTFFYLERLDERCISESGLSRLQGAIMTPIKELSRSKLRDIWRAKSIAPLSVVFT